MSTEAQTLALWERAIGRRGARLDEALLGGAPRSLPERNRMALRRYAELFGSAAELIGGCPHCGARVEFVIDVVRCAEALAPRGAVEAPDESHGAPSGADGARADAVGAPAWHELRADDFTMRFRLPVPADLHALESHDDAETFAEALLARCVDGGTPASAAVRDAVSRRMEALLPGASVTFALRCPSCDRSWDAPLDPVDLLRREVTLRAEQLLADVAALARRFGWSEREILALDPVRRAAYLQLGAA